MTDNTEMTDPIDRGLRAWLAGDLDALEGVLDPAVTLRWIEPGPWDCTNHDQVMALLRQRSDERGHGAPRSVQVIRVDEHTFVVSSDGSSDDDPQAFAIGTRVTVVDGRVIAMQQYRYSGDPLVALT